MCCNDCKAKEFNTSLNFPSLAPEPSALTLTINNAVCATAYILVMLQQHSWDVWAVLGRSVTLWPVCPTAHMHELTEGPGLRTRLSVNLRKLFVWSYFTNWPSAGLTFFLLTTAAILTAYAEWKESSLQNLRSSAHCAAFNWCQLMITNLMFRIRILKVFWWYGFNGSQGITLNLCNTDGDLMGSKCYH